MDFYTVVLRKSDGYWVSLCLENGIVSQGDTKADSIKKLKEAVLSFEEANMNESEIYNMPITIKELHEFLTVESKEPTSEKYELRALYA